MKRGVTRRLGGEEHRASVTSGVRYVTLPPVGSHIRDVIHVSLRSPAKLTPRRLAGTSLPPVKPSTTTGIIASARDTSKSYKFRPNEIIASTDYPAILPFIEIIPQRITVASSRRQICCCVRSIGLSERNFNFSSTKTSFRKWSHRHLDFIKNTIISGPGPECKGFCANGTSVVRRCHRVITIRTLVRRRLRPRSRAISRPAKPTESRRDSRFACRAHVISSPEAWEVTTVWCIRHQGHGKV